MSYNSNLVGKVTLCIILGFPGSSAGRESTCNAGDPGSIPGLRRYPGEGNGYPLQYSCLENFMDRGAQRATVHAVTKSDMTEPLSLSIQNKTSMSHYFIFFYQTFNQNFGYENKKTKLIKTSPCILCFLLTEVLMNRKTN